MENIDLFRAFMARRCLRIYPLSIIVVSVVYFSHQPIAYLHHWKAAYGNHPRAEFLPSLLLVQNFVQFDDILSPLWSLPYEIQMYCLFPFIYLGLRRFKSATDSRVCMGITRDRATCDCSSSGQALNHLGHIFAIPDMLFYFLWFLAGLYAYKEMQTSKRTLPFWSLPALLVFLCLVCTLSYDRNKFMFISFAWECLFLILLASKPGR